MVRSKFRRLVPCLALALVVAIATSGGLTIAGASTSAGSPSKAAKDLKKFLRPARKLPAWPQVTESIPEQTVYFMSQGDPTSDIIEEGIRDAANPLGWTVEKLTYSPADPSALNSTILSAIDGGANAVIFATAPESALTEAIGAAEAANVTLVQIGGDTAPAESAFVHVDNVHSTAELWGKMLAAATVVDAEKQGTTANVAVFETPILPSLAIINEQYEEALKAYCSECTAERIDVNVGNLFSGQLSQDAVSAIQRNPDINYLEFTLGFTSVGVRPGVDGAGFTDVRILGMLPTPSQLEELNSGGSSYWVVVPNRLDGWMSVDAIVRAVTGGDPTIHNDEVEPAWVLQENSKFDPSTLPELPINYTKFFKKLWNID